MAGVLGGVGSAGVGVASHAAFAPGAGHTSSFVAVDLAEGVAGLVPGRGASSGRRKSGGVGVEGGSD